MGYESRLAGMFVIKPPLKWSEYRDTVWTTGHVSLLTVSEQVTDIDDGTVRTGLAIEPRQSGSLKAYDLADELAALAERFGTDHTFTGYIVRDGDETSDVERHWIEGTTAKSETARLSWPDGTAVAL